MENLRIHSVHANNIGPFNDITLNFPEKTNTDLADIHIFSGENGTGKSTLLEILSSFAEPSGIRSKIHSNSIDKASIEIDFATKELPQNTSKIAKYICDYPKGQGAVIQSNALNEYLNKVQQYPYAEFQYAFFAYSGYRRIDQVALGAIQEIATNPMDQSLNFNNSINPKLLIQWIANTKTKEALSLAKNDSKKAAQYHNAIIRIEKIVSEITDQKITFELEDSPLRVCIITNGLKLQFENLPDGLKSIISWIADLLMRMDRLSWQNDIDIFDRNFILFLDEIEVHMHPKWQRKILPVIQKLFKNAQIFVSTHSPFVVGSIDNAWIYKFGKEEKYSHLTIPPFLSEDANSYRMILEDIFDIKKQFGVGVEKQLDRFYQLKNEILKDNIKNNLTEFNDLVKSLASQSNELENIIGMELKQIKKLKGEQFEFTL